jgi:tRNA1(Val) A37 N6-methylase TrmN6
MSDFSAWQFVSNQRKHTQDGPCLVKLMKPIGRGLRRARAVDVGCGDGIIASEIFRLHRASSVLAFDILPDAVNAASINLSVQSAVGRCLVERLSAQTFFRDKKNSEAFDLMVINPPFFEEGSGEKINNKNDRIARHDSKLSVKHWALGAGRILCTGGELYCVFPTERFVEACTHLSKNGVEPKEVWWLKKDLRRRRFFLRAVRAGKVGIKFHIDHEI